MNPADLTINTSALNGSLLQRNGAGGTGAASLQPARAAVPRVDLEPIYTQLKSALGDAWVDYKQALSAFVLGSLNQDELAWTLQPLLSPAPSVITAADSSKSPVSTLHLHNALLASLYTNVQRDNPTSEVAPWVVATDKPTASKNAGGAGSGASDQAEERLKREVMAIHARDRKRIKALKTASRPVNDGFREMQEYAQELTVKPPSQAPPVGAHTEPQSAGGVNSSTSITATGGPGASGLAKTNFDLEIRRRYAQPLACETQEFPSLLDMQNRIEPICYEEGLVGGVQQGTLQACAELIEQAAEVFVKEMLGNLLGQTRSNLVGAGTAMGVRTKHFRDQLQREQEDADRGVLQRSAAGLLPAEIEVRANLEPLGMQDLRFALGLSDPYLRENRFLAEAIMLSQGPCVQNEPKTNGHGFENGSRQIKNGLVPHTTDGDEADAMAIDDPDYVTFKGATKMDHDNIMSVLDDCLMAAG